ncbi:MAG: hypothetical protein IT562_19685 [Alphaproteobacteria bacterium]|nr:hypothetical protein [Alphaproteobacteria bacterium]
MRRRLIAAALLAGALGSGPVLAQQATPSRPAASAAGVAASGIARLAFAEKPQRSTDQEQETLALQMVDSLGYGCRGHEMYRWRFADEEPDRAQQIISAGERALKDKGYAVSALPVEIDTLTALMARHPNKAQADATVLALWYASDQGVDLTLCRVREK